MVGFASSLCFVEHETGPNHPERPDRIRAIHMGLREAGLLSGDNPFPDFHLDTALHEVGLPPMVELPERRAEEHWLRTVHADAHIARVKHVCQTVGGGVLDQGDTPVGRLSYDIAMRALGSVLAACDGVMSRQVKRAFAAIRPPGHHAEPDRAMGFCLFSNVAIAARYLQQNWGLTRVAIVDFDVHHGNGTQAVFDSDPSVLFVSLHEHPRTSYPGTGYDWEIGVGPGRGYTLNVPFAAGSTTDDYMRLMNAVVVPKVKDFHPEAILVSAGFDAHRDDPLGDIELDDSAYELMTRALVEVADEQCGGRVISILEGGYNLRALARSVVRHIVSMYG